MLQAICVLHVIIVVSKLNVIYFAFGVSVSFDGRNTDGELHRRP